MRQRKVVLSLLACALTASTFASAHETAWSPHPADGRAPSGFGSVADPIRPRGGVSIAERKAAPARTARMEKVFPVARRSLRDVVGHFGDRREGGRRWHRGIDIAAPRGTPVLAVGDGVVTRVEHTEVGGLVVWLEETRTGRIHYYAHLDAALTARGQKVRAGTPIGTVGNTGNAARTPPHLHYAVYQAGEVLDPMRLFASEADHATGVASARKGTLARTRLAGAALKSSTHAGKTIAVIPRNQQLEVLARVGRFYRVRYQDKTGYVARWLLDGA